MGRPLSIKIRLAKEPPPSLTFEVPLPPWALSPNFRVATRGAVLAKAQRVERYRAVCRAIAASEAVLAGWVAPAKARITLLWGIRATENLAKDKLDALYRPQDWDNAVAAFKAGQDGIVSAGVVLGDKWHQLEGGRVSATGAEGPFVRVTLEVVDPPLPRLFDD